MTKFGNKLETYSSANLPRVSVWVREKEYIALLFHLQTEDI